MSARAPQSILIASLVGAVAHMSGCAAPGSSENADLSVDVLPAINSETRVSAKLSSQMAVDLVMAAASIRETMKGLGRYEGVDAIYLGRHNGCSMIDLKRTETQQTHELLVCDTATFEREEGD